VFTTVLVPDWDATPKLAEHAARRKTPQEQLGAICGYNTVFSTVYGCEVILVDDRLETMPETLRELPMLAIHLVKRNSRVTNAVDGPYKDGSITARVDSYVRDGVDQQSFTVSGNNGQTLEELNLWLDNLVGGRMTDKNVCAIRYPNKAPASSAGDTLLVSNRKPDATSHTQGYIPS